MCLLLLLEVGLVLQRLLLIGSHVGGRLLRRIARHALGHWLSHWRGGVVLFGRVHGGFTVDAVGVSGFGRVQAGLARAVSGGKAKRMSEV